MTDRRKIIVSHASDIIAHYGIGKVTMSDVAKAAGVSRQTLYSHFGNKDALLQAVVAAFHQNALAKVQDDWAGMSDVDAKLEVYFTHTARAIFAALQTMPDAEDMVDGSRGLKAAAEEAQAAEVAALAEVFADAGAASSGDASADALARLTYAASSKFKMTVKTEAELNALLASLKAGVLALLD